MSFTYDVSTQLGQVRLLIADTDSTHPIFSDDEVNAVLTLESSATLYVSGAGAGAGSQVLPIQVSPFRAAALLLDALAANKSRLAAINQLLDVHLSAEKAAQELRATAKEYRTLEQQSGSFAIAEMVNDSFSARERVWKSLLRLEAA